jgi:integrase
VAISASAFTSWSFPRAKTLTPNECRGILSKASDTDPRLYVFLVIAANTALRLCEVLHLRAEDVIDGQLRIVRRKKKQLRAEMIDVTPALSTILTDWSDMYSDGWLFPGKVKPCIINRSNGIQERICDGGHMAKRVIQARWESLLRSMDLYMIGRGIHSLRHFGITAFYARHRDLRAAQVFAGHSSSTMTERYARVIEMREKVHAMSTIL